MMILSLLAALLCSVTAAPVISISPRTLNPPSPMDFSWIQNYTALGDSYAAGIGAGNALSGPNDFSCSRYDQSYPQQLLSSFSNDTVFQNLPCTGNTLQQVIDEQIPLLADNSQDLVTISAGGNDVNFTKIVIACVYGTSGETGCDDAIANGRNQIPLVLNNIRQALQKLEPKMKQDGVIAWTLYSEFWNATTDACDHETWAYWDNTFQLAGGLKLTKSRRQAMNDLTNELNGKMAAQIMAFQDELFMNEKGSKPLFQVSPVLWGQDVEAVRGAFCEQDYDPSHPSPDLCFIKQSGIGYYDPNKKVVASPVQKAYLDPIMKFFHPTDFGQYLISVNALAEIMEMRARSTNYILATIPACYKPNVSPAVGNLTCYGIKSNGWAVDTASFDPMIPNLDSRIPDACEDIMKWNLESPSSGSYTARIGGMGGNIIDDPGVDVSVSWPPGVTVTRESCITNMERIIGCDSWTADNPFNLKHGGFVEVSDGSSGITRYAIDPRSHGVVLGHLIDGWSVVPGDIPPLPKINGVDRPTLQACITDTNQLNSGQFRDFTCGNTKFQLRSLSEGLSATDCWKAMAPSLSDAVENWIDSMDLGASPNGKQGSVCLLSMHP